MIWISCDESRVLNDWVQIVKRINKSDLNDLLADKGIQVISERQGGRLQLFERVRTTRDEDRQELGYNSRPFILCGLPVRRPASDLREYSRVNGRFHLRIATTSPIGLPFGQDRLIPLWISTLAVKQKSRIVTFDSAAELLSEFGLSKSGFHYKRMVQGFERIFDATIYFGTDEISGSARFIDRSRFNFFDRIRLWYETDNPILPGEDFKNSVTLSEHFWNELQEHRIPVDLNVVRALANAPACLDFYCWLVWRCYSARTASAIPLTSLKRQLGVSEKTAVWDFRLQLRKWLAQTKILWPGCPARISDDGLSLLVPPDRSAVAGRKKST